jgi:hypothetical protein
MAPFVGATKVLDADDGHDEIANSHAGSAHVTQPGLHRCHPEELNGVRPDAGLAEEWRIVNRRDAIHRLPGVHVLAHRR